VTNQGLATVPLLLFAPRRCDEPWELRSTFKCVWSFSLLLRFSNEEQSRSESVCHQVDEFLQAFKSFMARKLESSSCGLREQERTARVQRTHGIDILQSQSVFWSLEAESRSVSI